MRGTLNINMWKVSINYKYLFVGWQCYLFMSLVQSSCSVATSLRGKPFEKQLARCNVNKQGSPGERQCQ